MKKNYYDILNISEDEKHSSEFNDILKKNFKFLAKKYHPDVCKDSDAEEKFKEVAAAYDILGNPEKREKYDKFGDTQQFSGNDMSMDDIFSRFGDVFSGFGGMGGFNFSDVFGGMNGFGSTNRQQTLRGGDIRIKVNITLDEMLNGVNKKFKYNRLILCVSCDGNGSKEGRGLNSCPNCNGVGRITRNIGGNMFIKSTSTCPHCSGSGKVIIDRCEICGGSGNVQKEEIIEVTLPKGLDEGMTLTVEGKGNDPGKNGICGNLQIIIGSITHTHLIREGNNLKTRLNISIPEAILGTLKEVDNIDGRAIFSIPAGIDHGTEMRLLERGIPDIRDGKRGDLIAVINIYIPKNISSEETSLIEKLTSSENFVPK